MALCLPIICGFPTKIKQDAPEPGRQCPRCHNASVVGAASRTWFELFWIPLIPFTKKRIWICGICRWEMKQGDGPDPQPPQQTFGWNPQGGGGGGQHNSNPYGHLPPPPGQNQGQGGYHMGSGQK